VLASHSPRRRELLAQMGIEFEVRTLPDVSEDYPAHLQGRAIPLYIAKEKADSYRTRLKDNELLITADTIVWLDGRVLGKPRDTQEAAEMLMALGERTHQVYTAICLTTAKHQEAFYDETHVTFAPLTAEECAYYVQACRPLDKAGAYGIQEWIGLTHVTAIEGSYFNVVGLPSEKLYRALCRLK